MKNVIITGSSSGVGLESAILFAQKGFKVYATMRNTKKATALKERMESENISLEVLQLDVTDVNSINTVVKAVIQKDGNIDILINNAGAGFARTLEHTTDEEIQWVTDVNYIGVVNCCKAVIPQMRKQNSGHIINITSVGGLVGQPFNELYCGAKFAVEGFTESLAAYLTDHFNIQFSLVEPGGITTEFMNSAVKNTMEEGVLAKGAYKQIFERYMAGSQKRATESKVQIYQTGLEVAEVIHNVASSDSPPLRVRTSEWAEQFCDLKTQADPDGLRLVKEVKKNFL